MNESGDLVFVNMLETYRLVVQKPYNLISVQNLQIIFQILLSKPCIKVMFALGHASLGVSFNQTMKNRKMKYMNLKILIIRQN